MSKYEQESITIPPTQEKAEFLLEHIALSLNNMHNRRKENRIRASIIKILIILLSTVITVFLGLQVTGYEKYFKDSAFILAAIVTILNAIEPFFNFRALWLEHEKALAKMYRLKNDVDFYLVGIKPQELRIEKLEEFLEKYKEIWNMLNENYNRHRRSGNML